MAILTPSRPPKPSSRRRDQKEGSLAGTASGWLNHPMADVVLAVVPTASLLGLGALMV